MTLSVVIPVYNEEALLADCLRALANQSRPPDEIIVVDNNSTDRSAEIARSFGVKVIEEKRQGIMPAFYAGMSASFGEIIARCDADSLVPREWCESIEKTLSARPEALGITGPGKFYGTNTIAAWLAQVWYMWAYFLLVGSALASWPLFGSNCAIRREAWQMVKDELHREMTDIHDDIDLSIHIPANCQIILDRKLVVGISARALTTTDLPGRYIKGLKTLRQHWPESSPVRRWQEKLKT